MERGKPLTRTVGLSRSTPLAPGSKGLAPGKGLTRSEGLARGTDLTRGAPLTGGTPPARQVPAPRPRKARVAPEVRDAVRARSRGLCEVGVTGDCRTRRRRLDVPGIGGSQHHRLPGRMGGSRRATVHAAANLLQVCGHGTAGCHGWIEGHREYALRWGWLLREGQDPAVEPVVLWDGSQALLGESYRAVGP